MSSVAKKLPSIIQCTGGDWAQTSIVSSFQNFLLYTCTRRWAVPGRCKICFCLQWKFGSKWSRGCPTPGLGGLQLPPCCCHSSCRAGADSKHSTASQQAFGTVSLASSAAAASPWMNCCNTQLYKEKGLSKTFQKLFLLL